MAIIEEDDVDLLGQLPEETQDSLFAGYLFSEFLITFNGFFRVAKGENHSFLTRGINEGFSPQDLKYDKDNLKMCSKDK